MTQLCIYLIWPVIKKQIMQSEENMSAPKKEIEKK